MRETKVVRLLSNFPPTDLSEFRDFVASPIFNKDTQVLDFVDLLLPHLPDGPDAEILMAKLSAETAGDGQKRLDKLKHRLVVLIWKYIDFRARYRPDDHHQHALARAEELWERNEERAHQKEIEGLETDLSASAERSSFKDWHTFQLAIHLATHAPHYDRATRTERLNQAWQSLDSLQKLQKLRYLCVFVNQLRITGTAMPDWLQLELEGSASLVSPKDPLSRTYARCLEMQMDPHNEVRYTVFMEAFEPHASGLAAGEARDLYQYAINFQVRRFNRHQNVEAAATICRLYETLLEKGVLLENGTISAWNYKNITSLMARIGALDWLQIFLDQYESQLGYDYADNAANFCRGLAAFYHQDFAETTQRMENVLVNFRNVLWGLEARALLLQSHYERNRHEDLETVYHRARMYVGRTAGPEVSAEHQAGYRNFNRLLYKLSGIVTGDQDKRPGKLTKLERTIRETDFLPNKAWLLVKVRRSQAK
jgi:hypothetical protein